MERGELLSIFSGEGTGPVSDALDLLGHNGGLEGLARLSGRRPIAGPAFTVRYDPVDSGQPAPAGDYVDEVPPGAVVVIANGGRTYCTVWGDILAAVAVRNGIGGTVIDGCCRDLGEIQDLDYPIWARGSYMKSGKNRVLLTATQVPVTCCGTTVEPGDIVCADAAGVVVAPKAMAARVAELVQRITALEAQVRADVNRGAPLSESRRRRGYNRVGLVAGAPPPAPATPAPGGGASP